MNENMMIANAAIFACKAAVTTKTIIKTTVIIKAKYKYDFSILTPHNNSTFIKASSANIHCIITE
jgi:hypothetical protein